MLTKSYKSLIALLTAALLMTTLLTYSGPRLRGYELDLNASIVSPERLVLNVNQQIKPVAGPNVTLSPSQSYKVTSSADKIFIDFDEPLLSGQKYELKVTGVESLRSDKSASKNISFTTPQFQYSYIKRSPLEQGAEKLNDKVLIATLGGGEPKTLYEAPRIDEIASVGSRLAVSEVVEDNSHKVYLIDKRGNREAVPLPDNQQITALRGSKDGSLLGFLRTDLGVATADRKTKLSFYDTQAKVIFDAIDGNIVSGGVSDWFLSSDSSIVAILTQQNGLFISPIDGSEEPVYYGRFDTIAGFSYDGNRLYVTEKNQTKRIDLGTGIVSSLTMEDTYVSTDGTKLKPKNASPGFIVQSFVFGADPSSYAYSLQVSSMTQTTKIAQFDLVDLSVNYFDSAPNDQFIFVETSEPRTAKYDNYPSARRPSNVITQIIDTGTGETKASLEGFGVTVWRY